MEMSNLPRDLVEEILSKLPVTSLKTVRLTCKMWNSISKLRSFAEKHISTASKFRVVMMMNHEVCLMGVNLNGAQSRNVDLSIKCQGKLTMGYSNTELDSMGYSNSDLDSLDDISGVLHCDGILLFVKRGEGNNDRVVVWNPYWGQRKLIQPTSCCHRLHTYALGYEKNNKSRSHKILRNFTSNHVLSQIIGSEIYDFNSNAWRLLNTTSTNDLTMCYQDVSLKGNTYWLAAQFKTRGRKKMFLICFDFTEERLGPHLRLPFDSYLGDDVFLYRVTVREKHLVVSYLDWDAKEMGIWVTSKIKPEMVSWSKFLAVDMTPFTAPMLRFFPQNTGFFIDEEKKVVVLVGIDMKDETRNVAYIIGEDGCLGNVDLGEASNMSCWPLICFYVPGLLQINQ